MVLFASREAEQASVTGVVQSLLEDMTVEKYLNKSALALLIVLIAAPGCGRGEREQLEKKNAELSAQLAKAEQDLQDSKAEAQSLISEIEQINAKAAEAENALAELQTKYHQATGKVTSVAGQVEAANRKAAVAEQALASERSAASAARTEIETLKAQVAELQKSLEDKVELPAQIPTP